MATRFYLPSSTTPPVSLTAALPSGWTQGASAPVQGAAVRTRGNTATTSVTVAETSATATNVPIKHFVSEALTAQTISGTFTAVISGFESATTADDALQVGIYLISNDGSTIKSTLYAGQAAALNTTVGALGQEFTASQETRIFPSTAITSQTAVAGDRLLIITGYRTYDTVTTSRSTTLRYGDVTSGEYTLTAGTTSDAAGWVELSGNLTFQAGPSTVTLTPAVVVLTAQTLTVVPTGAPSIRSVGPDSLSTGSEASRVIGLPNSPETWQTGDLVLIPATSRASTGGFGADPAGWTPVVASFDAASSASSHMVLYGRIMTGSETDPTISFAGAATGRISAKSIAIKDHGLANISELVAAFDANAATAGTPIVAPSVVPPHVLALVLGMFGATHPTNGTTWTVTPPADEAELFDIVTSVAAQTNAGIAVASGYLATTSATGTKTATASASVNATGIAVAIKPVTAPPSPSSVTLTPASLAFSAIVVTAAVPPSSVTLTPAPLALAAVSVTPAPGPTSVTLTPAPLALTAVAVTPQGSGPSSVTLTPASLVLSTTALTPAAGATSVTLTPASVALSARPLTPAAGATSVTLTPASFTLSATALTPAAGATSVTLTPAPLVLSARPLTPTSGPTLVTLTPAVYTLSAVVLSLRPTVILTPAPLTLTALPLGIGGVSVVALTPASLALSAQSLTAVPGAVSATLAPAVLALSARPLAAVPGAVSVTLTPILLTLSARPLLISSAVILAPATVQLLAITLSVFSVDMEPLGTETVYLGSLTDIVTLGILTDAVTLDEETS